MLNYYNLGLTILHYCMNNFAVSASVASRVAVYNWK